ncbi:hypothetical protein N658DRAFT_117543 [Parathielavia hyrcaniae]|uniref:Uncharacterized protein n=1 Tax=Parathielavia hyrcaniae TaxID=113614 RepID=A0AAN6T4Z6_9PEZI|nr:hypothetical protein N658DRAFT_117543 [Parathielavia hyrcaniae]
MCFSLVIRPCTLYRTRVMCCTHLNRKPGREWQWALTKHCSLTIFKLRPKCEHQRSRLPPGITVKTPLINQHELPFAPKHGTAVSCKYAPFPPLGHEPAAPSLDHTALRRAAHLSRPQWSEIPRCQATSQQPPNRRAGRIGTCTTVQYLCRKAKLLMYRSTQ